MTGHPGAPYFSTMYFGGSTSGEADAASDAVRAFWAGLVGFINTGLQIQVQSEVEQVDPVTGFVLQVFDFPQTVVAATGNAPLPFSTQGLIRWRTGSFVAGKEIRGRTFIPNLANDAQLNAVPSVGFLNSANAAGTALLLAGSPAGDFGVWSRKNGSFHNASSRSTWSQFAVLRSRRD